VKLNPHKDVQGIACLSLAYFLNNRLRILDMLKSDSTYAKLYESISSKDYLEELQQQDRAKVTEEVEALFEKAAA
jgi:hypothetical protein